MIKMICGVYGMREKHPGGGYTIKGVGPNDPPFSLTPEQEKRLVDRKVAVYVELPKQEQAEQDGTAADVQTETEQDGAPIGFDDMPPVSEGVEIPEYNAEMKADKLREIGAQFGLTFKVGMTKVDMVAALDKHFTEVAVEDEEGTADEGDAPTFDPTGAVV